MAAPEPFASAQLMEDRSQGAITTETHPYLEQELAAASRIIRDYCRWHVAPVMPVQHGRRGHGRESVWLRAMQIKSVDSVTVDGTDWDAELLDRVRVDPDVGWTNIEGRDVNVTFTAGYDPVPESIVSLTLQVAARALGSPLGFVREQAGGVAVTHTQIGFNQAGGVLLLPAEESVLDEYRIGRLP